MGQMKAKSAVEGTVMMISNSNALQLGDAFSKNMFAMVNSTTRLHYLLDTVVKFRSILYECS